MSKFREYSKNGVIPASRESLVSILGIGVKLLLGQSVKYYEEKS
jgi:hypothetical protein